MRHHVPRDVLEPFIAKYIPQAENDRRNVTNVSREEMLFGDITGKIFSDDSVEKALEKAVLYACENNGHVPSMPDIIALKAQTEMDNLIWKQRLWTLTEENIFIDKEGVFYDKEEQVVVVVHGGGILTPERIREAYKDGLVYGRAKYTDDEVSNLLNGKLPGNTEIQMYTIDNVMRNETYDFLHQFGVVMKLESAKKNKSGYLKYDDFMKNPLARARLAGCGNEIIEKYYNKTKCRDGTIANLHTLDRLNPSIPTGNLLSVGANYGGLDGITKLRGHSKFIAIRDEGYYI